MLYTSEVTGKTYKTVEELEEAEKAFKEAESEKAKKQEEKKARAKEVEEAYCHFEEVKREAYTRISEAEQKYLELRNKFAQDYGGYHMTYVNNNGVAQVSFGDIVMSHLIDNFMR